MGIPRLISLFLLAIGLYLLGADAANLIIGANRVPEPLGVLWGRVDPSTLAATQTFVQNHLLKAIWDPGVTTLLRMPAWTLPIALGALVLVTDVVRQRRSRSG